MALTAALVLSGLLAVRPPGGSPGEVVILMSVSAFGTWGSPEASSPLGPPFFLILPFLSIRGGGYVVL